MNFKIIWKKFTPIICNSYVKLNLTSFHVYCGRTKLTERKGIFSHRMAYAYTRSLGTVHGYKYKPQILSCYILSDRFVSKGTTYVNIAPTMVLCNLIKIHSFFKQRKMARQIHWIYPWTFFENCSVWNLWRVKDSDSWSHVLFSFIPFF